MKTQHVLRGMAMVNFWADDVAAARDWFRRRGILSEPLRYSTFSQLDSRSIEQWLTRDDQAVIHALFAVIRAKDPQPDANIELINAIIAAIETDKNLQTVSAVAKAFSHSERRLQQLFQEYNCRF